MIHDSLCRLSNYGTLSVFALGALVTVTFYLLFAVWFADDPSKTLATRSTAAMMAGVAIIGGMITLVGLSYYMIKMRGPTLLVLPVKGAETLSERSVSSIKVARSNKVAVPPETQPPPPPTMSPPPPTMPPPEKTTAGSDELRIELPKDYF